MFIADLMYPSHELNTLEEISAERNDLYKNCSEAASNYSSDLKSVRISQDWNKNTSVLHLAQVVMATANVFPPSL
jgi:hypothetical protein